MRCWKDLFYNSLFCFMCGHETVRLLHCWLHFTAVCKFCEMSLVDAEHFNEFCSFYCLFQVLSSNGTVKGGIAYTELLHAPGVITPKCTPNLQVNMSFQMGYLVHLGQPCHFWTTLQMNPGTWHALRAGYVFFTALHVVLQMTQRTKVQITGWILL